MSNKKENKKNNSKLLPWRKAFSTSVTIILLGLFFVISLLIFFSQNLPSIEQLQRFEPQLITKIYSSDGKVLGEWSLQKRIIISPEKVPQAMRDAVMAIEDAQFNEHWGFSIRGFTRALISNIFLGRRYGASTLTQQLARILYEDIGFEKTVTRKIKELITALMLEKMYTKDQILHMYINASYMGHGTGGIEAAANRYWKKHAWELSIDECAYLAGIIQNAGRYSPLIAPESGFQRRNYVLYRMKELGYLSDENYKILRNSPINFPAKEKTQNIAPYFVENIRKVLLEDNKLGINLHKDGLKIFTTLDTRLQSIADSVFQKHLKKQQQVLNNRLLINPKDLRSLITDSTVTLLEIQEMIKGERNMKKSLKKDLIVQGAFIALDPSNGNILVMIGGRNFNESEYNWATQAERQPGSVFKPIVYATAIDNGFPVTTTLLNQPISLHMSDGTRYTPQNYDYSFGGPTTLREGIRGSLNIIAARIVNELISPESVVETAKRMHLSTYIPNVASVALGVGSVKLQEIVSAYGIFQNNGIWIEPHSITRIEDRYGNVIKNYFPKQEMVLSEQTAFLTTTLLQTVINKGTGKNVRNKYGFQHNAAGKTGTTSNWTNAWFVGFTPHIAAGVFVGVDNSMVTLGKHESGARVALPFWAEFMKQSHELNGWTNQEFIIPEGIVNIEICKESKQFPSKYCTELETEYFTIESVPNKKCPIHSIKNDNGKNYDDIVF